MKVQAYTSFPFAITITVGTPRPEEAPSTVFVNANIHEDYAAAVTTYLEEHKHIGAEALVYPAAQRLQSYFPKNGADPIFALRQLMPAGELREIDGEWNIEIMRIRYEGLLVLLPGAWCVDARLRAAKGYALQAAVKGLFQANSVPDVFIPGDNTIRPGVRSEIDIIAEMGPGRDRTGVDVNN